MLVVVITALLPLLAPTGLHCHLQSGLCSAAAEDLQQPHVPTHTDWIHWIHHHHITTVTTPIQGLVQAQAQAGV